MVKLSHSGIQEGPVQICANMQAASKCLIRKVRGDETLSHRQPRLNGDNPHVLHSHCTNSRRYIIVDHIVFGKGGR